MARTDMTGVESGPSDARSIASRYRKLGARLLVRLAAPGIHAERRDDQIALVRADSGVSVPSGMPSGVLADLLESGAVQCVRRRGRSVFEITDSGRARVRRDQSTDNPFGAQHRALETRELIDDGERREVRINTREDPLDVFRRGRHFARFVGPAELDAGDRLARDLVIAQAIPKVTANWGRLVVDGAGYHPGLSAPEVTLEARRRVDAALAAVGPDLAGILMDALGFSKGIETLEREHGLPLRSGKVVLALALRHLARHYGLRNVAEGAQASPIRHWGATDYRPKLKVG